VIQESPIQPSFIDRMAPMGMVSLDRKSEMRIAEFT
jgi:hypothetical protein